MEKNWQPLKEVDFSNGLISEIHTDTRDFHCLLYVGHDGTGIEAPANELLAESADYFYTAEEVKAVLVDLQERSGGAKKWRQLALETAPAWQLKYIRAYRTVHGFVISNRDHIKFFKKDFWKSPVIPSPF